MHELSLATEIIELIRPNIPEGEGLLSVQVTVGLLAGICADSLQFCFGELARLEGYPDAELKIRHTPAHYRCGQCHAEYCTETVEQSCPVCHSLERMLIGGAEFTVDFIEVTEQGACHV